MNCLVTKVLFDAQKLNVETSLWRLMTWPGWLLVRGLIIHCKYKHHSLLKMFPRNHIKHQFCCSQPPPLLQHRSRIYILILYKTDLSLGRPGLVCNPIILLGHLVVFNPVNTLNNKITNFSCYFPVKGKDWKWKIKL